MNVFLSSTYLDLVPYRQAAINAISRLGLRAVAMEEFGAAPDDAPTVCTEEIDRCDLFVGVYAHRYGYVPPGSHLSITEMELNYARRRGWSLRCFCFLVDDQHTWPKHFIDTGSDFQSLTNFKTSLRLSLVTDVFNTPADLALKIASSLGRYLARDEQSQPALMPLVRALSRQLAAAKSSHSRLSEDLDLRRAVVFLLEATLSCHSAFVAMQRAPGSESETNWRIAVDRLVEILNSIRTSLATFWPHLFDDIHRYAYSETSHSQEMDPVVIHNSMHDLLLGEAAGRLVEEMEPLRSTPLEANDQAASEASTPLMASVRSLREVIKELLSPADTARFQAEFQARYRDLRANGGAA